MGLSLLVFRVLPLLDIVRAFIVVSNIYFVPSFLKTIFEGRDPNMRLTRKCSMFMLNLGVCFIQLGSILLCLMFQISMTTDEKEKLHKTAMRYKNNLIVHRPMLREGYFGNPLLFELPIALLLISLSYWENYVEGNFTIFNKVMTFKAWKKQLHHCRGRLYIFASVWKVVWTVAFAMLLQSGFDFNLSYTAHQTQDLKAPSAGLSVAMKHAVRRQAENTTPGNLSTINNFITSRDFLGLLSTSPLSISSTGHNIISTQAAQNGDNVVYFSPETRQHFERYGILYVQILSSMILTYFGRTACKMCMQVIGFSIPLTLVSPICVTIAVLQNIFEFLPTGSFVWIGPETGSNLWMLHLCWIGVLWLSELFIVAHIWFPNNGRMEKTDR